MSDFLFWTFIKVLLNWRVVSWMSFWFNEWIHFDLLNNFFNLWTLLITFSWINSKSMFGLFFNLRIFRL